MRGALLRGAEELRLEKLRGDEPARMVGLLKLRVEARGVDRMLKLRDPMLPRAEERGLARLAASTDATMAIRPKSHPQVYLQPVRPNAMGSLDSVEATWGGD